MIVSTKYFIPFFFVFVGITYHIIYIRAMMKENEKQVCLCICLFQSCRHNKYPARKKKLNKNKYVFAHFKSKMCGESIRER